MMRRHEKELEEQLSAKSKELTEKENALQALTQEIAALKGKIQEKETRILSYQEREGALVSAMTQVEALSKNRMAETESQVQAMLDDAKIEADAALSTAKERAAAVLSQAKDQAAAMLAQAEASVKEYKCNTDALNARLIAVSKQAKAQLASLEEWMQRSVLFTDNEEDIEELQSLQRAVLAEETAAPETYANPAELMQSIYSIERRDLPAREDEPMTEQPQPETTAAEEPAAEEPAVEEPVPEEPETEKTQPLWTVDDIVASVIDGEPPKTDTDSDAYLKQLIDDILQ
ncbi:MAG: hypothetical protein PHC80_04675 [Eubacteriales bacterium]|nr:hypothetical protein [Eubacteriales bacterium]